MRPSSTISSGPRTRISTPPFNNAATNLQHPRAILARRQGPAHKEERNMRISRPRERARTTRLRLAGGLVVAAALIAYTAGTAAADPPGHPRFAVSPEIGRASCRERV